MSSGGPVLIVVFFIWSHGSAVFKGVLGCVRDGCGCFGQSVD